MDVVPGGDGTARAALCSRSRTTNGPNPAAAWAADILGRMSTLATGATNHHGSERHRADQRVTSPSDLHDAVSYTKVTNVTQWKRYMETLLGQREHTLMIATFQDILPVSDIWSRLVAD